MIGRRSLAAIPPAARRLLVVRALRGFGDGFVSLLMPVYLTALGYDAAAVGAIATATLIGSGTLTLLVGLVAHRFDRRRLLLAATLMMVGTGLGFAGFQSLWPLMIVAVLGTFNPSGGDVSVFIPLEQSLMGDAAAAERRTELFALFSLVGAGSIAFGALFVGVVEWLAPAVGLIAALQGLFLLYAGLGSAAFFVYRGLPPAAVQEGPAPPALLAQSRRTVFRLAALFSLDAFGGGLILRSLLVLWLFQRFDMALATAGVVFFWIGLASAVAYPVSARLARRIGLINTMVFTHLPSNLLLMLVPFMPNVWLAVALLIVRGFFSVMDVPARSSYVMAVVSAPERAAAASVTAVPRSLAAALSPSLGGYLLALSPFGWPLLLAGAIKIVYDLLLLYGFRHVKPPEERR